MSRLTGPATLSQATKLGRDSSALIRVGAHTQRDYGRSNHIGYADEQSGRRSYLTSIESRISQLPTDETGTRRASQVGVGQVTNCGMEQKQKRVGKRQRMEELDTAEANQPRH